MNIEGALAAVDAYGEDSEPFDYRVSDLVTDLFVIARQREGGDGVVDMIMSRVYRDLDVEPESAADYRQLAYLAELDGLTSWAAKLYDRAGEMEQA